VVWFAPGDARPLFAFAGLRTEFKADRGPSPACLMSKQPTLTLGDGVDPAPVLDEARKAAVGARGLD